MTINRYLLGNFAPVTDERDDDVLEVSGAIPPQLDAILDATDFAGPPIATLHLPRRIPFGFHSSWVPGASLG
jgi:carotenoid cleavage dioxygenase